MKSISHPIPLRRCSVLFPVWLLAAVAFADEAQIADDRHLGAATCASSVCHGKLSQQDGRNVWLNEYRIWTGADRHSRAYRSLQSDASRAIAQKLGLPSAATADVCLDCHADNVAADQRGPKFQLTDGVGCEACHGAAERWIESHAAEGATHQANLDAGMYPTESPVARAMLCLSCHMGTAERFAGHDIYGAGHPRLSFELEAFTANQPAHYDVDADYRDRKGEIPGFNLWLSGQVESARRFASLVEQRLAQSEAPWPELSLYDCHACHHDFDELRWSRDRAGPGLRAGGLRLQDHHFQMLEVFLRATGSEAQARELTALRAELVQAAQRDLAAARRSSARLREWLAARQPDWATRPQPADAVRRTRRAIIDEAAAGGASDYAAAEQVYLAMESLSYSLGDRDRLGDTLDALYEAVEDYSGYDPDRFAATASRLASRF